MITPRSYECASGWESVRLSLCVIEDLCIIEEAELDMKQLALNSLII